MECYLKRFLTIIILFSALCIFAPFVSYADESDFQISSDGTTVEAYTGTDEVVTIPDGITTIAGSAFYGNNNIKKVIMPDSLTTIKNQAFRECHEITDIIWSQNLKTIEYSAFEGLQSIRTIAIPDGIEHLDSHNFSYCYKLEYVKLPSSLKSLGLEVFSNNSSLRAIVIPESVTEIGNGSFLNNNEFTLISTDESAAHKYATKNDLSFSTTGKSVPYSYHNDGNGTLEVDYNGTLLNSETTLKIGDLLRITAKTDWDDLAVMINGSIINYGWNIATSKKNELDEYNYLVVGPTDISLKCINVATSLDDALNVEGGTIHFNGELVDPDVFRGGHVATMKTGGSLTATIVTEQKAYVLFKSTDFTKGFNLNVDGTMYNYDTITGYGNLISHIVELKEGQHILNWTKDKSTYGNSADGSLQIAEIQLVKDIKDVKATSLSIPIKTIDLDINESLTVNYEMNPELIKGIKDITWTSSNNDVVSIENGVITGISQGKAKIYGTVDGITASAKVYVSDKQYDSAPVEEDGNDSDPTFDDSKLISEKTALSDEITSIMSLSQIFHIKDDPNVYVLKDSKLYRINITEKNAKAELLYTTPGVAYCGASRGHIIYLAYDSGDEAAKVGMIGYNVETNQTVYEQSFDTGFIYDGFVFAVDDYQNFYFGENKKDLYSYNKKGELVSKDIQSAEPLITGVSSIIVDEVDPFNRSILVRYPHSMGRGLRYFDEFLSDLNGAINFIYTYSDHMGFRLIRNGEIISDINYVKDPIHSIGYRWQFLDRGHYAVNGNGMIVRFYKDSTVESGVNYEYLYTIPDMNYIYWNKHQRATYVGGYIYVANSENVIYKYDPRNRRVAGTYSITDMSINELYSNNGRVFYSGEKETYVAPLTMDTYKETGEVIRTDHVTLTYSKEEVESKFAASCSKIDYSDDNLVYSEKPSIKAPYAAGALSTTAIQETLNRLNYARWQSGLNELSINDQYMERNQKGAVVMAATDELTHYPSQPSDMDDAFFKEAYAGCNATKDYEGNCSKGNTVFDAIKGYLDDTNNVESGNIGHRLSLLKKNL